MFERPLRRRRPVLDSKGLPEHGASWDEGVVLRGISRGEGVPVPIRNPRATRPRRIVGALAGAPEFGPEDVREGTLLIVPTAPAGQPFALVVEY